MAKLKVIITGATGMVGEGVLHECLQNTDVEKVLVISRRPTGYSSPKLEEIIHNDFLNVSSLSDYLKGYNACFFCLGVTSLGKKEPEYTKLTYTLTLNFATVLAKLNTEMTFCYISGSGTDSTERGRIMWARVKGKTENDLMKLPFKQVYNFRPAMIEPYLPLRPTQTFYKAFRFTSWLSPVLKVIAPNYISTLKDLAQAMIKSSLTGYPKNILEVKDINLLTKN